MMNAVGQKRNRNGFTVRAANTADVDIVVDLANSAALVDIGMIATHREDKLIE